MPARFPEGSMLALPALTYRHKCPGTGSLCREELQEPSPLTITVPFAGPRGMQTSAP